MKKLIAGAVALAVVWMVWPYYALYDLANSINRADPTGLERRIEWASVRQGLREDLNQFFVRNVAQEIAGRGFPGAAVSASLGAMIGPALIDKTLNALATPQAVAALIAHGKVAARSGNVTDSGTAGEHGLQLNMLKYAFFSSSPFDFKVEIASANEAPIVLLFTWNGDWRLTRVVVPRKTIELIAWNK